MSRAYSRVRVALTRCTSFERGAARAARVSGESRSQSSWRGTSLGRWHSVTTDLERRRAAPRGRAPRRRVRAGVLDDGVERAVGVVVRGRAREHRRPCAPRATSARIASTRVVRRWPRGPGRGRRAVAGARRSTGGRLTASAQPHRQHAERQRGAVDARLGQLAGLRLTDSVFVGDAALRRVGDDRSVTAATRGRAHVTWRHMCQARPVQVHLVDGTYELFRQFLAPRPGHVDADGIEVGATRAVVSARCSRCSRTARPTSASRPTT